MRAPLRSCAFLVLAGLTVAGLVGASDPAPGKGGVQSWEAGDGVKLRFKALPGPTPIASAALPAVDLAQLPGSRVVLRKGYRHAGGGPEHLGASVYAVCLRGPSSDLPGDPEEVAFDKLDERAEAELKKEGAQIDQFASRSSSHQGHLAVRPFSGEATPPKARSGIKDRLVGKHFVGFLETPPEILVCSFACVETSTSSSLVCGPVVEGVALEGAFVAPPKPGLLASVAHASTRRPLPAVGLLLGALLSLVGVGIVVFPGKKAPPSA